MNLKHRKIEGKFSITNSYITMPIMAQYAFPIGIYVEASLEFVFLTGKSVTNSNKDITKEATDLIKDNLNFNKFDLGLSLGAAYHFNKRWNVNLRYT